MQTVSPIIERMARALAEEDAHGPGDDRHWQDHVGGAIAALAAIREPSDRMIEAAIGPAAPQGLDAATSKQDRTLMVVEWQAMIDAALEEG